MLTELSLWVIKQLGLGSLSKFYTYIVLSYAALGCIKYIVEFWHSVWESNTPLMVKCFACYSLCNTQDQWMLHHSIQNETTAAQSTENPCSRTYQRVVLLLSGKQKPVSNPAEGKVLRPAWSTHPRVHVPTASVPTLSHQSTKKRRGKKKSKTTKKTDCIQNCRG